MQTGGEANVLKYPLLDELQSMTFDDANPWRERFGKIPFDDKSGAWQPRYYQHTAIDNAIKAIADGKKRILLTLARGKGKTAIAFQIAWTLFHSRWNVTAQPTRRPCILFLADRNIPANQAYNSFSAFDEDALKTHSS